jgi:hypothetical protein
MDHNEEDSHDNLPLDLILHKTLSLQIIAANSPFIESSEKHKFFNKCPHLFLSSLEPIPCHDCELSSNPAFMQHITYHKIKTQIALSSAAKVKYSARP